jgi:hypothetical protein
MSPLSEQAKQRYLTIILTVLCALFLASLFKNISYPLFWADESMTAMGGVRVLEYGYPKVHDGKNVFYDLLHPDKTLGIDKKTDAYIGGAGWGQYYFATLGVKLAELSDDFYTKTAIIRSTFTLAGLAGLVILALLGMQFFGTRLSRRGFLALFVFFEVISMPLALHLREARYYPLVICVTALTIFIYARYRILKNVGYATYGISLIVLLFLSFLIFSPAYFIFLGSFFLFETALLAGDLFSRHRGKRDGTERPAPAVKKILKEYVLALLPVVVSLITILPLLSFFETFYIARKMAAFNLIIYRTTRQEMYVDNFLVLWRYFASSDFIYLAIFLKACLLFCLGLKWRGRTAVTLDRRKLAFSSFLSIFFVLYFAAMCKIPNFPYTRYFIPLQPVLAVIVILDAAVVYDFISGYGSAAAGYLRGLLAAIVAVAALFNIATNFDYLKGHLFEITHQYRGPLDYVIPYIRDHYPNPENLVIAANYEETSFMYYLGAKVTVGYVGQNLMQDYQVVPDIIIFRKSHEAFAPVFRYLLAQRNFVPVAFPVYDWLVNNFPELNQAPRDTNYYRFMTYYSSERQHRLPIQHLFRTKRASQELEEVYIFVVK